MWVICGNQNFSLRFHYTVGLLVSSYRVCCSFINQEVLSLETAYFDKRLLYNVGGISPFVKILSKGDSMSIEVLDIRTYASDT